jgi:GTPase
LKLPVGTIIHNLTTGVDIEIEKIGGNSGDSEDGAGRGKKKHAAKESNRIFLAKGGIGGRGNFQFKGAHNTSPRQFDMGRPGESFEMRLELKFIADVGFVGLPNAGKSSMLNVLTRASAKVANYPFTTLEPNLGVYYELILADIPGLIEGSSTGRGLGVRFLRHIERTRILFHFISAESLDPVGEYKMIRRELGLYSKALLKKPEYLFLSKSDLLTAAEIKKRLTVLKKLNPHAIAVSTEDPASIKKVQTILNKIKGKE